MKIALIILLICVLFEMVLMFVKSPFISSLAYVFVLGVYLLNYFDRAYIRVCLAVLLTSIVLDFIWLLVLNGVLNISYLALHAKHRRLSF